MRNYKGIDSSSKYLKDILVHPLKAHINKTCYNIIIDTGHELLSLYPSLF